jgi:plasmid stabilization system protein ParE
VKLRILPAALKDLTRGKTFYARLDQGLGGHFLDSLFGDIDSLAHHAGSHQKVFGYHRLLAKRFPFAIYYKKEGDICVVWRVLDCRQNPAKTIRALK